MKYRMLYLLGMIFLFSIAVESCKKLERFDEIETPTWEPSLAFPLVNTSVSMADLLQSFGEEGGLVTDPNNVITLVYKGERYYVDSKFLFNLISDFEVPMPDTIFYFPYNLPNDVSVDYILMKEGNFKYGIISQIPEPIEVKMTILELSETLGGAPYTKTVQMPAGGTIPATQFGTVDLAGYYMTPTKDTLTLKYKATKISDGTEVQLGFGQVVMSFDSLVASYAQGYLGEGQFDMPRDTIDIDFFNAWEGSIYFEEPSITITTNNSFGFPLRVLAPVCNVLDRQGNATPLSSVDLTNGVDVNYPLLSEVGATKATTIVIDESNSNLPNVIGYSPKAIEYEAIVKANVNRDPNIRGFLTDTSAFSLDFEIELPFHGRSEYLGIRDTFDMDWSEQDNITFADFKLVTENGFPLEVNLQMYFLSDNKIQIDSLLATPETILEAGAVDGNGRVVEIAKKISRARLDGDRFDIIKNNAKYIVLKTGFETYDASSGTSVRIYDDYDVAVRLGVILGVEVEE